MKELAPRLDLTETVAGLHGGHGSVDEQVQRLDLTKTVAGPHGGHGSGREKLLQMLGLMEARFHVGMSWF